MGSQTRWRSRDTPFVKIAWILKICCKTVRNLSAKYYPRQLFTSEAEYWTLRGLRMLSFFWGGDSSEQPPRYHSQKKFGDVKKPWRPLLHHVQYWIGGLMCSLGTCHVPYSRILKEFVLQSQGQAKGTMQGSLEAWITQSLSHMHHRRLSRCMNVSCMKNQNQQERGLHVFGRVCFMYWYALSTERSKRNLITILLVTWPSKFWTPVCTF